MLDLATRVMRNYGIKEDVPRSKKHLNYETLNLKSKRILNRMVQYLAKSE